MPYTALKDEARQILAAWQELDPKPEYDAPDDLAGVIDHTLLKPQATDDDVARICDEALRHRFASVCVNPVHVHFCAHQLAETEIPVASVIGFPLGATTTKAKTAETRDALTNGAEEFDMVLNVGRLKSGEYAFIQDDIAAVVSAAGKEGLVKVILETCLLAPSEIVLASLLTMEAGAHYVKTSTGFSSGGATLEDVGLMRYTVGDALGVKASGGIGDRDTALAMCKAGATRLGASAGVRIISG